MIKALILLGALFLNTDICSVISKDTRDLFAQLNHVQRGELSKLQATDWLSLREREKSIRLKSLHIPPITTQKRCSDMDTVLNGCKEESGSIYEAHQRTALAYSRRLGSRS